MSVQSEQVREAATQSEETALIVLGTSGTGKTPLKSVRSISPASPIEKLQHYERFVERAAQVFGDELTASRWLSTPASDLAGKVPLQVAQELQYDPALLQSTFEPIFVRIEHGIYW